MPGRPRGEARSAGRPGRARRPRPGRATLGGLLLWAGLLACGGAGEDGEGTAAAAPGGEALRITHVVVGEGASPSATDRVVVHYHGTFPDGRVFDSSVERGEPARFPLDRVIPCWTRGLQEMKVGGRARLVCPPEVAYGESGAPPRIPPNATLHFEVELLGIE